MIYHTALKIPAGLLAILLAALALGLVAGTPSYVAEAQEQNLDPIDETQTENNQEEPEPQTPNEIVSVYDEQMTLEEVVAECHAGAEEIANEFNRLTNNIRPYEISHPQYYESEKAKTDSWLTETTAGHNAECEEQKEAALARELPPSPVPGSIATSYHDRMTLREAEAECENIKLRITAEYGRLLTLIEDFKDSHPEYHTAEKTNLDAWQQLTSEEKQVECEEQTEAARARELPPTPVDDLYPQIPQEIKDLAAELELTDEGKTTLYNNNPKLFDDPNDPEFTCSSNSLEEEVYIYGCWDYRGSIKVLRDNSTAITLAHELLHVVYYDFYISYRNGDLDKQIDAAAARDPAQTQIILNAYAKQLDSLSPAAARYVRHTELHSFVGTQFGSVSPALEEHYARYFKDRQIVLNIFHDWLLDTRAKLAERQKYNQQLLYQAGEYQKCLNDLYATTVICQVYLPEEEHYLEYDECLASNKTFLRNCWRLKPALPIAYVPIPPPPTPPPVSEPNDQSATEAAELISRTNERQQEAEEDFVNQLAEHDHELTENAETDDPDRETSEEEEEENEDAEENDEREQTSSPEAEGGKAAVPMIWLFLIITPLAGAGGFTITYLILKSSRQKTKGLAKIQQQAGRIPLLPEIPQERDKKERKKNQARKRKR